MVRSWVALVGMLFLFALLCLACAPADAGPVLDGRPRSWVRATVGGYTGPVWGWQDANGLVGYWPEENPQIAGGALPAPAPPTPAPAPAPAPAPRLAGVAVDADGTLNAGLNLEAQAPGDAGTHLDTNDRAFAERFYRDAEAEDLAGAGGRRQCPDVPELPHPVREAERQLIVAVAVGFAGIGCVIVLCTVALVLVRRRQQP